MKRDDDNNHKSVCGIIILDLEDPTVCLKVGPKRGGEFRVIYIPFPKILPYSTIPSYFVIHYTYVAGLHQTCIKLADQDIIVIAL